MDEVKDKSIEMEKDTRSNLASSIVDVIINRQTKQNEKEGLSIAITAGWGYGKTYFLEHHLKSTIKKKMGDIETIFINAHELDYAQDPFLVLGSKLSGDNNEAKKIVSNIVSYGLRQAKTLIAQTNPNLSKLIDLMFTLTKINLNTFEKMEKEIRVLKNELSKNPKVIIIDELDRCKPEFADALLEAVKHFFNTPNVYFVLAINLDGANFLNDKPNRNRIYYEKFFDYTFDLPKLSYKLFIKHKINTLGNKLEWLLYNEYISDISLFCKEEFFNISLRQLDKILVQMSLLNINELQDFTDDFIDTKKLLDKKAELIKCLDNSRSEPMVSVHGQTYMDYEEKEKKEKEDALRKEISEINEIVSNLDSYFDIHFKDNWDKFGFRRLFILFCLFKHSMYYNNLKTNSKTNPFEDMYTYLFNLDYLKLIDKVYSKASMLKSMLLAYDDKISLNNKIKLKIYYDSIITFASLV